MQTTSIVADIVGCLDRADYVTLYDLYTPDALFDSNVRRGASSTPGPTNLRCTQLSHFATDDRVVESEYRFDGGGGEHLNG
jgi:hypothetical protein